MVPVYRPHPPRPRPAVDRMADKPPEKMSKDATFVAAVFGDSLGQLLGVGLADVFADRSDIGILRRARENTGLTRDDVFDWVKGARDLAGGPDKIKAAVVLIGSNDRQPIREGDTVYDPFTPKWSEIYRARIAAVAAAFKARGIPLIWVGLPVPRSDRLAADFARLNDFYREEAAKEGTIFIDVWEAFTDEHGQYSPVGPGTDGQVVRLRTSDGVNFTRAGTLKLAHFVEGELRRDADATTPGAVRPGPAPPDSGPPESGSPAPPVATAPAAPAKPVAGPVLSLTGPPSAAGAALAQRTLQPGRDAPVDTVLTQGRVPDSRSRELSP